MKTKKHTDKLIQHHTNHMIQVREDYLRLCEGDHCAAAILSYFESWTEWKREHKKSCLVIFKSQKELREELLYLYGKDAIIKSLNYLVNSMYLIRTTNKRKKYSWDHTYQYQLNIELINNCLNLQARESEYRHSIVEKSTIEDLEIDNRIYEKSTNNTIDNNINNNIDNTKSFLASPKEEKTHLVSSPLAGEKTKAETSQHTPPPVSVSYNLLKYCRDVFGDDASDVYWFMNNLTIYKTKDKEQVLITTLSKFVGRFTNDEILNVVRRIAGDVSEGIVISYNTQYVFSALLRLREPSVSVEDREVVYTCRCGEKITIDIHSTDFETCDCKKCHTQIDADFVYSEIENFL